MQKNAEKKTNQQAIKIAAGVRRMKVKTTIKSAGLSVCNHNTRVVIL